MNAAVLHDGTVAAHADAVLGGPPSNATGSPHSIPNSIVNSTISAVLTHNGPVLLDFDETIYLRNSTEDFIDSARPALLALIVMRVLDALKPWRWTGGVGTRDVWRVRCIQLLFPWTKHSWAKRVRRLAETATNTSLCDAIKRRAQTVASPTIITTLGFDSIVTPLAAAMGLGHLKIIACRATVFSDRREGKLRVVVKSIGNEAVRRSLVLTDSKEDEPLLSACAVPLRVEWPQARFVPALSAQYLPGQYLSQIKRPGERYIARGILQEDFALWVLASLALSAQPIAHVGALLLLLISFWAIYEAGYVDNDRIAAKYEDDPKLSRAFGKVQVATPRLAPWVWALASGTAGVVLLRGLTPAAVLGLVGWIGILLMTAGAFALYNRFDKNTRIWWYCGLQLARSAAFVVLVPIHLVGAMAIGAHVLAKWIPYYIYRVGGKSWPESSHFMTRLLFFVLLSILVGFASGFSALWSWSAAALLAWNVYRARTDLLAVLLDARRLDRDPREERLRVQPAPDSPVPNSQTPR
ncbi:MAG TPA: hypothetical protein VK629_16350 [Steroidobacteraceae bacterium]|nr:hypothetical protein [Steroidobacteraceae bacterium]